jgi:tyrosyl-tRNA synthetase
VKKEGTSAIRNVRQIFVLKENPKMKFNPNAFEILQERGFIHTTSHEKELKDALKKGPVTFYLGIDPTADDLHIGNVFGLRVFKILQDCGHKGILLIGNATSMIGDPSLKNDMRKMLTQNQVENNASGIQSTLHRFIDIEKTTIVYNADWMSGQDFYQFMYKVGSHFNVSEMLSKECYKNRIGKGLTFLEMSYMLMQGYDFIHLNDKYNCTLQIGGSDQWSNILAGVDLSRKMALENGKPRPLMFGLCFPLLTNTEGIKMGKTEKGALWVNPNKTSAYDFYQYFVNVADADVERLLIFFTDEPINQIKNMCQKNIVDAKKFMATKITEYVHGEKAGAEAQCMAQQLFSGLGNDAPTETITAPTRQLVDILSLTSIIKSKREARELIESGAIQIDGERITDVNATINKTEFLVKKGKKTFLKVIVS